MRVASTLVALTGLLTTILIGNAEDRAPVQKRIAKPGIAIVPAVQGRFQLRVQKSARFPKEARPAASQPASVNGLVITVQPEKKEFAGNGPLAFEVTLKNSSKNPITLPAASRLGGTPKLVTSNQKTAAQWTIAGKLYGGRSQTIAPGKTLTCTVVVEANWIGFPRPIPLPQPIPRRLPPQKIKGKAKAAQIKRGAPIGRPIRPPVWVAPTLPIGQGDITARLFVEFSKPEGEAPKGLWTGKIASATFTFKVGKPEPGWTPGQPLNKQQAIRLAHPVAERALSAAYKPIAGLRPPKQGPWIENPEKTATVKKDKNGNWTVSWAEFPKTGHSYNVTVTVSKFGGASVREVFTGYSKRP